MTIIEVNKEQVNSDLLAAELLPVVGPVTLAVGAGRVKVTLPKLATETDIQAVKAVITAHDAGKFTPAQQAEAGRAAAMETLRKPWAEWTAADQAVFLRLLAEQMGIIPVE